MYVSLYDCMFVTINVRLNEINMFKPNMAEDENGLKGVDTITDARHC